MFRMFSRTKSLLKLCTFHNVFRGCKSQSLGLENHLESIKDSYSKQCYSLLFFDEEVQRLLKKISNIVLEKVFRPRPMGEKLDAPVYKLMTTEELESEIQKAHEKAKYYLQIPPLVNITEDKVEILDSDTSLDGYDKHHCNHIFIDISDEETNDSRLVVVREANGVLRTASKSERHRINQIYKPIPGRELETPEMFEFENLMKVIERKDYEFILDRACAQFEPDESAYHEVITLTYEAINFCKDFHLLHSTRHFGSLAFYLVTRRNIDNMLNDNIQENRIEDAFDLVKIYHIVHPKCKSAELSGNKTDMEILEDFIEFDSNDKRELKTSLQNYVKRKESEKELEEKTKEAHGL